LQKSEINNTSLISLDGIISSGIKASLKCVCSSLCFLFVWTNPLCNDVLGIVSLFLCFCTCFHCYSGKKAKRFCWYNNRDNSAPFYINNDHHCHDLGCSKTFLFQESGDDLYFIFCI